MKSFIDITCFEFPIKCLEDAYSFLKKAGDKRFEAVALFAGEVVHDKAIIRETILPEQTSYKMSSGLMYSVEGEELHRINVWLYKNKLTLLAQIHSHPQEAYHSETDDEFPIISTVGGLSFVVPFFASGDLNHSDWAYYRLLENLQWTELDSSQIKNLIKII